MSPSKFNRKYKSYQPSSPTTEGPPTQRICKAVKCEDSTTTTSASPEPPIS